MKQIALEAGVSSGAMFSPCERYRYRLWRRWSENQTALFVLCNPSVADAEFNDPTVERCQRRALAMGCGAIEVVNIFAFRSTDPEALYAASDPIGPDNDISIFMAAMMSDIVICGWGTHGALNERGHAVQDMLRTWNIVPHALKVNADGSPAHPLYLPYSLVPVPLVVV